MTWIKCTNPNQVSFYDEELLDEVVEFSSNQTANVSDDEAKRLVENVDTIQYKNSNDEGETTEYEASYEDIEE